MFYELAKITVRFGTAVKAAEGIQAYVNAPGARGTLHGVWFSDIGDLNQIAILRSFDTAEDLLAERQRGLESDNPFGAAELMVKLEWESYKGFPWLSAPEAGAYGGVYEIRTYKFKTGGLPHTLAAWEGALPARAEVSPCLAAMYALDGEPRFTQVWPYADLNERAKARADAVKQGIWPPKGGPDWLTTDMYSQVFVPMAISPLK